MSVLTFQLTKMGLKGYELDYDNVTQYYEPKNYSHFSGRVQRIEEADPDWQRTYEMAKKDTVFIDYKQTHNYERWQDENTPFFRTGEMKLLEGYDLAKACLRKICEKYDASKTLSDREVVNNMIESFARAIANLLANKKLGMNLPSDKLFYNRSMYCVKQVMHDKTKETMREFMLAINAWGDLSVGEMKIIQ